MKHDSAGPLRSIPPTRRILSALSIVLSLGLALAAFAEPLGAGFTYQGQLQRNGAAYNGTCNFQFSLWDAASAGTQKGPTQSIDSVNVVNGLFTVVLDFRASSTGDQPFEGDAFWIAARVQCSGDGGFTPLDPRQPITPTPYALGLRPGAFINGRSDGSTPLTIKNNYPGGGIALLALGGSVGVGVSAEGQYGVVGFGTRAGVYGLSSSAPGSGPGVYGETGGEGPAIYGYSGGPGGGVGPAIHGENHGTGLAGRFDGSVRVEGGMLTVENGGGSYGIFARGSLGGLWGRAEAADSAGVSGVSTSGAGVYGRSEGSGPAIYGQATSNGLAGRFTGSVVVEGNLIVQGVVAKNAGTFRIDHPLDPANKFLSHSFVESPDMMNIYNGNVTTDATGSATVTLPDYFDALNRDCRYQLTVLGQFAQAIVSRKVAGNSFEIRTDKPGVEVSWQVTGIRQDAYARANPIVVEESKPAEQLGMYLYPAGFGAGEEKGIGYSSRPATAAGSQEAPATESGDQAPRK
jgi:hypothetical protein